MKIVADEYIPFLEGVFEKYADVVYIPGEEISHADVVDADALIIRNRTVCNAALLEGTKVSMIAVATTGTDHIDFAYCRSRGIYVRSAKGCYAGGVMQYVFSALYGVAARKGLNLKGLTFGIIGVGNVGRRVEHMAIRLGFKVLLCDPLRTVAEGPGKFCSLDYLLANSNIVTLHTPLDDSTRGMADASFFARMQPGSIFINTSRGEVVDEDALLEAVPKLGAVVIDTWCNEPDIRRDLMEKVDIATPHIACYSYQGKINGTAMSVQAVARHFGIRQLYRFRPEADDADHEPLHLELEGKSQGEIASIFQYNYPIFTDDFMFRMQPEAFERLRSEYNYRKEIYIELNMFGKEDIAQIESRGSAVATVESQVERFKNGFPWMRIAAPATPGRGIKILSEEELKAAGKYYEKAEVAGKAKFVPASGAASRMFKDLFAGLEKANEKSDKFVENISKFAFFDPALYTSKDAADVLGKTLLDDGLGYGKKPKGVLKFHKYATGEVRTAFAEHLVEAQNYMRNADGSVDIVVTISPEHLELFKDAFEQVREEYEKRYGVKYNITFTYQDKGTDTIAVDALNKPFRKEDGTLLFRPAGHGALIYNLNEVPQELVSIKNIDNVSNERLLPVTAAWKKALMGCALELRDRIFGYIKELDAVSGANVRMGAEIFPLIPGYNNTLYDPCATDECQSLCNDIEEFLRDELCITIPYSEDCRTRVKRLREKLDRPIRVCGMVRNQGEPGGGPFVISEKDGSTSLQILESVQINMEDPSQVKALSEATHFNPVDLVCCLRNHEGEKFNLLEYVDEEAGFISSKSYQGRELKALELPGLWNGAMSRWNTLFVEVPLETFNPVKTVLDLLRPAHQEQ